MTTAGGISAESLLDLRRRLDRLPPRHKDRKVLIDNGVAFYGVSRPTVYRALHDQLRPKSLRRADRGAPRKIRRAELERYCEIVAALKIRTSNKQGRRLSTNRALELIEEHGVETPAGVVQAPPGLLNRATINRYLKLWGYDHARMTRAPAAVRFEARTSNALWQFDMSPSDLREIEQPTWIDPTRNRPPAPMLYSVVDDRSGVAYQEYRCVYGEDVESGLRFLFNAMAPKEGHGAARDSRRDLSRQRPGCAKRRVSHSHGASRGSSDDAPARRQRWSANHGALERQGRAAVPDRKGSTRDALPLPQASDRDRG